MPKVTQMTVESVKVNSLKPHPQNYRVHPEDQLEHIAQSLREHGLYRNIVIGSDGVILAGHGVVEAAKTLGWKNIEVRRLDIPSDHPRALKILTGDNELSLLAEVDDRALSELLKSIADNDVTGLLGTGYDSEMLANLIFITRPASEIKDFDEAAAWVGMPEYEGLEQPPLQAIISLESPEDLEAFCKKVGFKKDHIRVQGRKISAWFPPRVRDDLASLKWGE